MPRNKKNLPIESVLFTYTGSDKTFTEFLKNVVHDYLNTGSSASNQHPEIVDKVDNQDNG